MKSLKSKVLACLYCAAKGMNALHLTVHGAAMEYDNTKTTKSQNKNPTWLVV